MGFPEFLGFASGRARAWRGIAALAGSTVLLLGDAGHAAQPATFADGQWVEVRREPARPLAYRLARGWTATLRTRHDDDDVFVALTVRAPGAKPLTVESDALGRFVVARFGAFPLDRVTPTPVVLFVTYTGGAHCCDAVKLLELRGGKWTASDLGEWNGGFGIEDADGDGRPELIAEDQRFLYRFGSYAGSSPPSVIYEIRGGELVDASAQPRYRGYYARELPRYRKGCVEDDLDGGPCAGFVATALRAGEPAEAAFAVLDRAAAAHGLKGPWSLPERCGGDPAGCGGGANTETSFSSLHAAVDWFLRDTGYLRPSPDDHDAKERPR